MEDVSTYVPYDPCLGLILFEIPINDISHAIKNSTVSMHADDTALCYLERDISRLNKTTNIITIFNNDLKLVQKWLRGNKLSLKVVKSYSLLMLT